MHSYLLSPLALPRGFQQSAYQEPARLLPQLARAGLSLHPIAMSGGNRFQFLLWRRRGRYKDERRVSLRNVAHRND